MSPDMHTGGNQEPCLSVSGLNAWPVNNVARRMLVEEGEAPDPESLYIFQLALWALKTDKAEAEADVRETVNAMTAWRPERIMNFLMLRGEHEEYDPPQWRNAVTPLDLALLILGDMEDKMVIHFPWYRSVQW
jgi:hypothetical protein